MFSKEKVTFWKSTFGTRERTAVSWLETHPGQPWTRPGGVSPCPIELGVAGSCFFAGGGAPGGSVQGLREREREPVGENWGFVPTHQSISSFAEAEPTVNPAPSASQ